MYFFRQNMACFFFKKIICWVNFSYSFCTVALLPCFSAFLQKYLCFLENHAEFGWNSYRVMSIFFDTVRFNEFFFVVFETVKMWKYLWKYVFETFSIFCYIVLYGLKVNQFLNGFFIGVFSSLNKTNEKNLTWGTIIVFLSNFFSPFLEELRIPKIPFKINWPLAFYTQLVKFHNFFSKDDFLNLSATQFFSLNKGKTVFLFPTIPEMFNNVIH